MKVANVTEFNAAVVAAKPGDVIVLADGEWRDADLMFHAVGEMPRAGDPAGVRDPHARRIKLRAETPGKVILTGASRLLIGGKHLEVSGLHWKNTTARDQVIAFRIDSKTLAEDCTLRECAIIEDAVDAPTDDATTGGIKSEKSVERKWVSLYGRRNRVELCRFEGKRSGGALLVVWIPDDAPLETDERKPDRNVRHVIERNFFGSREKLGKNGGETIRIGDSKTSLRVCETRVVQNYFYHCDGEAEIISNKSCKNGYTNNAFIGCSGALTLRHGNDCGVGLNLFHGDGRKGTGGVRVVGERHRVLSNQFRDLTGDDARAGICVMNGIPDSPANGYVQVRKLSISRNSFVDCKQSILLGFADKDRDDQTLAPDDVQVDGNIVVADTPVFTVKTLPSNLWTLMNNSYIDDLGLPFSYTSNWNRFPRVDLEADMKKIPQPDAAEILKFAGPSWMRPTENFLPQPKPK